MQNESIPILNGTYSQVIIISNNEDKNMRRKKACKKV